MVGVKSNYRDIPVDEIAISERRYLLSVVSNSISDLVMNCPGISSKDIVLAYASYLTPTCLEESINLAFKNGNIYVDGDRRFALGSPDIHLFPVKGSNIFDDDDMPF